MAQLLGKYYLDQIFDFQESKFRTIAHKNQKRIMAIVKNLGLTITPIYSNENV